MTRSANPLIIIVIIIIIIINSFGDRSFSAAGPRVWNALLSYLRQDMNYSHFKHALKGHMFRL